MELAEFLREMQDEIRQQVAERMDDGSPQYPFPETVFTEIVMNHMAEAGMTFEPVTCHFFQQGVGRSGGTLRLNGYAISDEADQLDLFVSIYDGKDDVLPVSDTETKLAAEQCLRFLTRCATGKLIPAIDPSNDVYDFAVTVGQCYVGLDQIRVYVLTDHVAKAKNFKSQEIAGKTIKLEIMDIERLFRHMSAGKPRDELVANFQDVSGSPLPCVYVPGESAEYDYIMTVIPGESLRFIYERYGARLLEANVRSFLSATGKVNKGIRDTLREVPERFMAYNNGIVLVADEAGLGKTADGGPGLSWLKGMQIVNGGQTTASIYFSKKRDPGIDLGQVRVPAKVIVLRSASGPDEEALIASISKFANSQNVVKTSDLSANHPFHVEVEKLSISTYLPDGVGRWFYERAAGGYNTMMAREGNTPARLRRLRQSIPPARKITKTDLAKYINAWDLKPDLVSLGSQKNFERFMDNLRAEEEQGHSILPGVDDYKRMIAKAIVYKAAQRIANTTFQVYRANIVSYVVAVLGKRLGPMIDLEKVWQRQDISAQLRAQLQTWAIEVNDMLHRTSEGRMISEWAKKPECREAVLGAIYSAPAQNIPEIAAARGRAGA